MKVNLPHIKSYFLHFVERLSESDAEKKQGDIDARIRAPIYESFKVYMMNKVRTKTEVHLGKFMYCISNPPLLTDRTLY